MSRALAMPKPPPRDLDWHLTPASKAYCRVCRYPHYEPMWVAFLGRYTIEVRSTRGNSGKDNVVWYVVPNVQYLPHVEGVSPSIRQAKRDAEKVARVLPQRRY